jgi:hypothetical protein
MPDPGLWGEGRIELGQKGGASCGRNHTRQANLLWQIDRESGLAHDGAAGRMSRRPRAPVPKSSRATYILASRRADISREKTGSWLSR